MKGGFSLRNERFCDYNYKTLYVDTGKARKAKESQIEYIKILTAQRVNNG
jgi:hypothetical protein